MEMEQNVFIVNENQPKYLKLKAGAKKPRTRKVSKE